MSDIGAGMRCIFGVRVPEAKPSPKPERARFALPSDRADGRATPIIYEFRRYSSWAEAMRETGLTIAKLRWDIEKELRRK
jgi:hypothetical protein